MGSSVVNLILLLKSQFICCLHTAEYHYLFECCKVFEYQTETDLLNRPGTQDKGAEVWGSNAVLWL